VVAGVLIDRLTTTPLATVSYLAADGHEIAWSQIEGGESVRFASSSPVVIDLGGFEFSPATSLALEFPSTATSLPWQAATTLLLADRDGAHPIAIANLSGAASGYPVGYSPSQVAHVRLPHLEQSQVSRLMIQPFDGRTRQLSPDFVELSLQQSDQFPNRLDLRSDHRVWLECFHLVRS
jgi:hypothetical protein